MFFLFVAKRLSSPSCIRAGCEGLGMLSKETDKESSDPTAVGQGPRAP